MAQAYHLLTLPNAHIAVKGGNSPEFGSLNLECVIPHSPDHQQQQQQNIFLVLRINTFEIAVDPTTNISLKIQPSNARTYIFHATEVQPTEFALTLPPPPPPSTVYHLPGQPGAREAEEEYRSTLEIFEGIVGEYADLKTGGNQYHDVNQSQSSSTHTRSVSSPYPVPSSSQPYTSGITGGIGKDYSNAQGDLRGKFILVNEDSKEVLGEFDNVNHAGATGGYNHPHDRKLRVKEDPRLYERGHENDPVVIEVPEGGVGGKGDGDVLAMFARAVPPEEQDWITKSATLVSKTISASTNILLSTVTAASSYYIAHSAPSPHHPVNASRIVPPAPGASQYPSSQPSTPGMPSATGTPGVPGAPNTPFTQRALSFITSPSAKKGLSTAHTVSGHMVTVSGKTVNTIDNMVRRAMGGKAKKYRGPGARIMSAVDDLQLQKAEGQGGQQGNSTMLGAPGPYPPPYTPNHGDPSPYRAPSPYDPSPGHTPYGTPPPHNQPYQPYQPYGSHSPIPGANPNLSPNAPPLPPRSLTRTARLLLSADLILSTIDKSLVKVIDVGSQQIGAVVGHKYGAEAQHSSNMVTGTAKNAALVYVDMAGIGRRALLKTAGKEFVKKQMESRK